MRSEFLLCVSLAFVGLGACTQPAPSPLARRAEPMAPASAGACNLAKLDLLLRAPHDPPTRDEILAACDDPVPHLRELAEDTGARGMQRLRALESLADIGGSDAVGVLVERAGAADDLASVRRTALVGLARATPKDDRRRERVGLGALSDSDAQVRAAAAKLLGGSTSRDVQVALERARDGERVSFVRDELARALERD